MPGFGIDAGLSRTTQNTVQTARKINETGQVVELTTFGAMEVITEEDYAPAVFTNAATDGQTGTVAAGVVTENTVNELAEDYAKETTVTERPLGS